MYCINCGNKLNDNDKFCANCGIMKDVQKNYNKRGHKKMKWLLFGILALFVFFWICLFVTVLINFFSGRVLYEGKLHDTDDFINYVDNLMCETNNKKYSCGLKNNYEIVFDEYGKDENFNETRTMYFKLKNSDFVFYVKSAYHCTKSASLDASSVCRKYTYDLSSNYRYSISEYYVEEYNKIIEYNDNLCYRNQNTDKCLSGYFYIDTYDDLYYIIDYMNRFLNYINSFDVKIIDNYVFHLNFPKIYNNGANYSLYLYFDIVNNKYIYRFMDEYKPVDVNIETYLKNYMSANEITLE